MAQIPLQSPIQNLSLIARQVVEGFLIGLHKSPFHGFSVEFAEHRLYNSGDNLKYVDWKVYGRSDKLFIKKFEEETNLRCCLAIDTSSSMNFSNDGISKLEYAAVIAASISFLIKKQMDANALALFDDHLYHLIPPKAGAKQQQVILNELEQVIKQKSVKKETNLANSLHELAERIHQRSLMVIFSDIPEDPDHAQELLSALQHLKYNKHEVLLFHIIDAEQEMNLEFENRPYNFEDMETGEIVRLNPEDYKEYFSKKMKDNKEYFQSQCLKYGIDYVFCDMSDPPGLALSNYLAKRNKMM